MRLARSRFWRVRRLSGGIALCRAAAQAGGRQRRDGQNRSDRERHDRHKRVGVRNPLEESGGDACPPASRIWWRPSWARLGRPCQAGSSVPPRCHLGPPEPFAARPPTVSTLGSQSAWAFGAGRLGSAAKSQPPFVEERFFQRRVVLCGRGEGRIDPLHSACCGAAIPRQDRTRSRRFDVVVLCRGTPAGAVPTA